jgi:hypothetical protein
MSQLSCELLLQGKFCKAFKDFSSQEQILLYKELIQLLPQKVLDNALEKHYLSQATSWASELSKTSLVT